jgi:hypothetical protein
MFTSSEYFDMLVLYGQCDESDTVAAQDYAVRFSNWEHPSRNMYYNLKNTRYNLKTSVIAQTMQIPNNAYASFEMHP